jgi:hypothetical protein
VVNQLEFRSDLSSIVWARAIRLDVSIEPSCELTEIILDFLVDFLNTANRLVEV